MLKFLANFILKNKNKVKGWIKEPANFLLKRMLVNSKGQHSWLEMVPDEASFTNLDLSFFSQLITKTQLLKKIYCTLDGSLISFVLL